MTNLNKNAAKKILVEFIDAKGINVTQPIWPSGVPRIFQNFDDYPDFQQKARGM